MYFKTRPIALKFYVHHDFCYSTLGLNLMSYFQPRRPLRPQRKERKRIQASNLVGMYVTYGSQILHGI